MSLLISNITAPNQQFVDSVSTVLTQYAESEEFRKDFHTNTSGVLANAGIDIPHGVDIEVVSNSEETYHLVLPSDPSESLTDEVLQGISGGRAGGSTSSTIASVPSTLSTMSTA